MADVAEMKIASKGQTNSEEASRKQNARKGEALAIVIMKYINGEVAKEIERSAQRMKYVRDIVALTPEGHQQFRSELARELAMADEIAKQAQAKGVTAEDESRHGGYSAASFRVMVSCFRTISAAAEMGWKPEPETISWDDSLAQCRTYKKVQAAAGTTVAIAGTRKQGAGRKALTDLAKAQKLVAALSRKDKMTLCVALAAELGLKFDTSANK